MRLALLLLLVAVSAVWASSESVSVGVEGEYAAAADEASDARLVALVLGAVQSRTFGVQVARATSGTGADVPGARGAVYLVSDSPVKGTGTLTRAQKRNLGSKRTPQLALSRAGALSADTAFRDPLLGPLMRKHPDTFVGSSVLAVFLAFERIRGAKSPLQAYLEVVSMADALSDNSSLISPLLWQPEGADRALLQGSWVLDRILSDEAALADDYARVTEILFADPEFAAEIPADQFTLELYMWAWSVIWTRGYYFDEAGGQVLLPALDFCLLTANKEKEGKQNIVTFNKGRFVLEMVQPVAAGEPIECAVPHNRASNDFYRLHGFRLQGTVDSLQPVAFLRGANLALDDPDLEMKEMLLEKHGLNTLPFPYSDLPNGLFVRHEGVPDHVVAYTRLKHWKPTKAQQQEFISSSKLPSVNPLKQITQANEEAAIQAIVNLIESNLDAYPDAYTVDKALLDGSTLNRRQRLAVQIRYEEKQILNGAHQSLVRGAQKANNDEIDRVEKAKKRKQEGGAASGRDEEKYWFEDAEDDAFWEGEEY